MDPSRNDRREDTASPRSRRRLAALGALGHAPALWLFARRQLTPKYRGRNVVALGLTAGAMLVAGLGVRGPIARPVAIACAWAIGHFAWSTLLARGILRGEALD